MHQLVYAIMVTHMIAHLLFVFTGFSDATHCYIVYRSDEIEINYAIYIGYQIIAYQLGSVIDIFATFL